MLISHNVTGSPAARSIYQWSAQNDDDWTVVDRRRGKVMGGGPESLQKGLESVGGLGGPPTPEGRRLSDEKEWLPTHRVR